MVNRCMAEVAATNLTDSLGVLVLMVHDRHQQGARDHVELGRSTDIAGRYISDAKPKTICRSVAIAAQAVQPR